VHLGVDDKKSWSEPSELGAVSETRIRYRCRAMSKLWRRYIGPDKFDKIAQASIAVPWMALNPIPIKMPAQVREILDLATCT